MKEQTTVTLEISLDELMGLIRYCNKMYLSIPEENYDDPTMDGCTFGETAERYKKRSDELYEILNEKWPK